MLYLLAECIFIVDAPIPVEEPHEEKPQRVKLLVVEHQVVEGHMVETHVIEACLGQPP